MNLNDSGIAAVLLFFSLYLVLEFQDIGVSIISPVVSRTREENKAALGLLKPGIDGNEIWLFLGMAGIGAGLFGGVYSWAALPVLAGAACIGMLFRLSAPFLPNIFKSGIMMKLLSAISFINLFVTGVIIFSLIGKSTYEFSWYTLFGGIWLIISSVQMGSLYGAVKVVNPLGERFRATSLVTGLLSLTLFVIFVFLSFLFIDVLKDQGDIYFSGAALSVILSILSFVAIRMRKLYLGLVAGYLYHFYSVLTMMIPLYLEIVNKAGESFTMTGNGELPVSTLIIGGAVFSGAVFIYRLLRKKEEYTWNDYI